MRDKDYLERAEDIAEKLSKSRDNRFNHLSLGDRATAMVLWFRNDELARRIGDLEREVARLKAAK